MRAALNHNGITLLGFLIVLAFALPASAQVPIPPIPTSNWYRGGATLDLDFIHDQYWLNGTNYADNGSPVGTALTNFISGAGATFTRAGTTNVTTTSPPSFSPFFLPSADSFVSRADLSKIATYFDNTGTLQTVASNGAGRTAAYTYNGSSWVLGGTLAEPAAANSVPNNTMSGAAASSSTQLATNGTFSSCSGSTCSGWTTTVNGGTGSVSFSSGTATLTGDSINAASIYQAITTVSGYTYTITVANGAGNAVTVQAGTTAGSSNLRSANTIAAGATTSWQFTASGTTSYVQVNNTSTTTANVTSVSVTSAGELPTNWNIGVNTATSGLAYTVIGTGTSNGINYIDLNLGGTAVATSENPIAVYNGTVTASIGQQWT